MKVYINKYGNRKCVKNIANFNKMLNIIKLTNLWIKNQDQKDPVWKDEIWCYDRKLTVNDYIMRPHRDRGLSRHYTINMCSYDPFIVIENNQSTSYELFFESANEKKMWIKEHISGSFYILGKTRQSKFKYVNHFDWHGFNLESYLKDN